ncbi:MAG: alpha/beta fold hydrolase [Saprospiraceae bacterium]
MKKWKIKLACSLVFFIQIQLVLCAQDTKKEEFILHSKDGFDIAGEIEYPNRQGKFPTAILIWGSGPQTRDQEISGSPMFKQIASFLNAKGMAVVRIDKRGCGKSTGSFKAEGSYTTRDLANDISLVYSFVQKHKAVDISRIGLIGHSEGSIIASILGTELPGLNWIIEFGPSAVPGDSITAYQTRLNRLKLGMPSEVSNAIGKVWEKYFRFIKDGYQNDSAYYSIGREFLIAHGLEKDDKRITPAFIDQLLDGYKTPWNQYFFNTDPASFLEKIKIPFLAVFGGDDMETSVNQNLIPMYSALSKSGNKNYRIVILPDEDHFFLRYQDKQMTKHKFGEMKVSARLLNLFADWFKTNRIL